MSRRYMACNRYPTRQRPLHKRLQTSLRRAEQSHCIRKLARTCLGPHKLFLQRGGHRTIKWRSGKIVRIRRLQRRPQLQSRRRRTCQSRRIHIGRRRRPNVLRHLPSRRLQHPHGHRHATPRQRFSRRHPTQSDQPLLHSDFRTTSSTRLQPLRWRQAILGHE